MMNNTTTSEVGKASRNYSLDMLKTIASFLVVCGHFLFYGKFGVAVDAFIRFVVPVFFMTSGYFSYNNTLEKLKRKTRSIVIVYLAVFILYFCFYSCLILLNLGVQGVKGYFISFFDTKALIRFFVFNEPRYYPHFWFLSALIYCYFMHYFVVKWKFKEGIVFAISVLLLITHIGIAYVICYRNDIFLGIREYPFLRNFLFMGYPFFFFGLWIRKKEDIILKTVSYKACIIIFVIGSIEAIYNRFQSVPKDLYFGSICAAIALFIITLKMKNKTYSNLMMKISKTSTTIYMTHVLVGNCLNMTPLRSTILWKYASPVLVVMCSLILALLINDALEIIKKKKSESRHEVVG